MSILIKGMKMPNVCDRCWALDESGDYPMCRITGETRGYNFRAREKRMDRCPLIELPDHGDLIERDELMKHAVYMPMGGGNLPLVYMSYVKSAKAIIPAERSEDGET